MDRSKKKVISYVLMTAFLLYTFFVCAFMYPASSVNHENHSDNKSICCQNNSIFGINNHHAPSILGEGFNSQLLLLILVSAYIYHRKNSLLRDQVLKSYFARHNRHWSFSLLYYLTSLFSKGILHPKIY